MCEDGNLAQPLVYVVMLNWNDLDNTAQSLRSVLALDYDRARVVVVDNGSVDGSVTAIRGSFPKIDLIENGQNLGFAGGMNVGIRYGLAHGADYVLLLNNDVELDCSMLRELVDFAGAHPLAGLLAPKIYYYHHRSLIWSAGCHFAWFPPRVKITGMGKRDHPRYDVPRQMPYATGCALLIRRDVLGTVGLFDPIYWPIYNEDYDYCARVSRSEWRIWYVPTAKMWHKESRSQKGTGTKAFNLGKNTVPFYLRHCRLGPLSLAAFVAWVALREVVKGDPAFVRPYLSGVQAGIARHRTKGGYPSRH